MMRFRRKLKLAPFLGVFTCLGSLVGLIVTFNGFLADDGGLAGFLFLSTAFSYFLWGVFIGARCLFARSRFRQQCIWFWLIQAPVLNSPYFSFHAVTGAFCALWLRLDVYDVGFAAGITSQFEISVMGGGAFSLGVNMFALTMIFLVRNIEGVEGGPK